MATYLQIYAMQQNTNFVQQTTVACTVAAGQVLNEATNTADHTNRVKWANAILGGNSVALPRTIAAICQNATLQSAAPSGPWADSDIQFAVNSYVNVVADSL